MNQEETYFQKISRQNSAYIVFRYVRHKKETGFVLTDEEQKFYDSYMAQNY